MKRLIRLFTKCFLFSLVLASVAFVSLEALANRTTSKEAADLHQMVSDKCKAKSLPVDACFAVIDVESRWNPNAINFNEPNRMDRADHGLMQINYQTAKSYGVNSWLTLHEDPSLNADIGSSHLSKCRIDAINRSAHKGWRQVWRETFACYNGGQKNWKAGLAHADKVLSALDERLIERMQEQ